jgi:hypothetical protein
MAPQNASLQTRIDQIILWTQNTKTIRTILWKDMIESFEDFEQVLLFIVVSSTRNDIQSDKVIYSMDFGMRQLNIIVDKTDGMILTITF